MGKQVVNIGDTGGELVSKLANNFDELYSGFGNIYVIKSTDSIENTSFWTASGRYMIVEDYDFLGNSVSLPDGIVLIFNGGIWSNGTIVGNNTTFISYGEKQCFEIDLDLDGTWDIKFLTPQNYGAITNGNTSIFSNDSSVAIQKCVDTGYPIFLPWGFYYIASTVIFNNPVSIYCQDGQCDIVDAVISTPDHVRIYTNNDIDIFNVRSSDVNILGGIIDITRVNTFTHSCIKISTGGYNVRNCNIKTKVNGSITKLKSTAQTGYGIYCDFDSAVGNGSAQYINIDCTVAYFVKGLNVPESPTYLRYGGRWTVKGYYIGNKQEIIFNEGSYSNIDVFCQSDYVNTLVESENPSFELGADYTTFKSDWPDYGGGSSGGFYTNQYYLRNYGTRNFFPEYDPIRYILGSTLWDTQPSYEVKYNPLNNDFKNIFGDSQRINSYYRNNLAYFFKTIPTSTIQLYDGDGYDFDTKLDDSSGEGLGAATSMTLTTFSGSKIGEYRSRTPEFTFINELKKETDFCEIIIPWTLPLGAFYIYLLENGCRFQRVQTIIKTDTGDLIQNDYPALAYADTDRVLPIINDSRFTTAGNISKIIIRFIGGTHIITVAQKIHVQDIYLGVQNGYAHLASFPLIDIGGGQTIYGTLGLTGALKQTELSGALTDGAPTDGEIDSITGTTPAAAGAGWKCTIKDTSGTGLIYLVESDGSNWFYTTMTKAV